MNEILKEVLKELKSLNNCKIDQRKFRVTLLVVHGLSHRASKFISPYPDNFIDMVRFCLITMTNGLRHINKRIILSGEWRIILCGVMD